MVIPSDQLNKTDQAIFQIKKTSLPMQQDQINELNFEKVKNSMDVKYSTQNYMNNIQKIDKKLSKQSATVNSRSPFKNQKLSELIVSNKNEPGDLV